MTRNARIIDDISNVLIAEDVYMSLSALVEDCGKFLSSAGKSLRCGICSTNKELPNDQHETNIELLLRVMSDVEVSLNVSRGKLAAYKIVWDKANNKGHNNA